MTTRDPIPNNPGGEPILSPEAKLDALAVTEFIRATEELSLSLNRNRIRPNEYTIAYAAQNPSGIVLPEAVSQAIDNLSPVYVNGTLARDGDTRAAAIEIATLDEDRAVTARASSSSRGVYFTIGDITYPCSNQDLGIMFASSVLNRDDNDELILTMANYYDKPAEPIDPTRPEIFSLLVASATSNRDTDETKRFALHYPNITGDYPIDINYTAETHVDGTKKISTQLFMSATEGQSSRSAVISINCELDKDQHVLSFDVNGTSTHSSLKYPSDTLRTPLDPQSTLDFAREVIDNYIIHLDNSTDQSNHL